MPVVECLRYDMLQVSPYTDILVNPVNCRGVSGKGLALAFKDKYPEMYEAYRAICLEGKLQMGKLHIYHDEKTKNTIINLPTKNHWVDTSNIEDVELGIKTLSRYIETRPLDIVAVPMLGTGEGKLELEKVMPLFYKYLDHLPNIIQVCVNPDRYEKRPIYVSVGGSREYADFDRIEMGFLEALVEFGLDKKDITAVISGGARGVDTIMCGSGKPSSNGIIQPNVAELHGLKPIIAKADWDRYGKAAGFVRNRVMAEIGTHIVTFVGSRSVGTRNLVDYVHRYNEKVDHLIEKMNNPSTEYGWTELTQVQKIPTKKKLYVIDISKISL